MGSPLRSMKSKESDHTLSQPLDLSVGHRVGDKFEQPLDLSTRREQADPFHLYHSLLTGAGLPVDPLLARSMLLPGLVPNPLLYGYPFSPFLLPPSLLSSALLAASSASTSSATTDSPRATMAHSNIYGHSTKPHTEPDVKRNLPTESNRDLTTMECAHCGSKFKDLCELTIHMKTASCNGKSSGSSNGSNSANRKFVRGQDMWIIGRNAEETQRIMSCMSCGASFRSLPELTVHMMETEHYWKIAPPQQIRNMIRTNASKSVNEMVRKSGVNMECTMCGVRFSNNTEYVTHITQCSPSKATAASTPSISPQAEDLNTRLPADPKPIPPPKTTIWTPPIGNADIPARRSATKRKPTSDDKQQVWVSPSAPPSKAAKRQEVDNSGSIQMLESFVKKHSNSSNKPIVMGKTVAEIAKEVKQEMMLMTDIDDEPKEAKTLEELENPKLLLDPNSVAPLSANPLCQLQKLIEEQNKPTTLKVPVQLVSPNQEFCEETTESMTTEKDDDGADNEEEEINVTDDTDAGDDLS